MALAPDIQSAKGDGVEYLSIIEFTFGYEVQSAHASHSPPFNLFGKPPCSATVTSHHYTSCMHMRDKATLPCRQHEQHTVAVAPAYSQRGCVLQHTSSMCTYTSCQRCMMWRPGHPRVPRVFTTLSAPYPPSSRHTRSHPKHTRGHKISRCTVAALFPDPPCGGMPSPGP